jgi:hypothetical protein
VVTVGHAMASSAPVYPLGRVCGVQVWPPFVVAKMDAPGPGVAEPTAVQCIVSAQAMAVKLATPGGSIVVVHVTPPLFVRMMLGSPAVGSKALTAWQSRAVEHETPTSLPTLDGIGCAVHINPPSFVPIATGAPNVENPTAIQLSADPHEMLFKPLTVAGIPWSTQL